jgi:hypothetical protein
MPAALRRNLALFAAVMAVIGWSLVLLVGLQAVPQARAADGELLTQAEGYIAGHVNIAIEPARGVDALRSYAAGPALEAAIAEAESAPAPMDDLVYSGGTYTLLLRSGSVAFVEADYVVGRIADSEIRIVEHLRIEISGGAWKVTSSWRVEPDPNTPLTPVVDPNAPLVP